MLILLPPSEGKASPVRGKPLDLAGLSHPELTGARSAMLETLVDLCSGDEQSAASTLGLGVTQQAEVARNAAVLSAPTARADRIYTGVLYEALDLPSLPSPAKSRASRWIAIMSGLFGMVRPQDRIPSYRLSGDVTLPGIGKVSTYWARQLDAALTEDAGSGLVIDLRSSTYAPFWRPAPGLRHRVVTVRVLHEHNGTRKVVSHFNKATKGRLVRSLLVDGDPAGTPEALVDLLGSLGWTVDPGPKPGVLDVVVSEL